MENVKYIPGDLVIHYGVKSIIDVVSWSQKRDDVCYGLHHLDGNDTSYQSFKKGQLIPINLTPAILEANGWLKIEDKFYSGYQHPKDWRLQIQILKDKYAVYLHDEMTFEFNSVHQLQHLLFGLGLDSSLKV